jgi:signal transduction histidine kinase
MSERRSREDILELNQRVVDNPILKTILEYAPVFVGVMTAERQFVLVNEQFFSRIGFHEAVDGLGMRPGEVFGCIHMRDVPSGCGDGPSCRYCSVLKKVFEAIDTGTSQTGEVRLTTDREGLFSAWDLMINVEPVEVEGQWLYILFMQDISAEKRKTMMERIFFHDILNSISSLDSLLRLLHPDTEEEDPNGYLGMLGGRISDVVEQIHFQKQLLAAEKGEAGAGVLNPEPVDPLAETEDIAASERQSIHLNGNDIRIDVKGSSSWIISDRVLFRRILLNMLKNAREASGRGDNITVSIESGGGYVQVMVHNPAVMPPEVCSQVFQRSFSTKGAGRGLGTYSMKLLANRFLGGDVTFRSEEGFGTGFTLKVPASLNGNT